MGTECTESDGDEPFTESAWMAFHEGSVIKGKEKSD
jgi:hypothetical protein